MSDVIKSATELALKFGNVVENALICHLKKEPVPADFYEEAKELRDSVNDAFQKVPADYWASQNRALELSGTHLQQMYRIAERAIDETNRNLVPHGVSGLQKLAPVSLG